MSKTKRILLWVMAGAYAFAGMNHLMNPQMYVNIMPPGLPEPGWLNVISGLAEIVLAVYVLEPRTRVYAAWGLIALLIAVFPANLYVAVNNIDMATGQPGAESTAAAWIRLPFQLLFIVWAWWYTLPDDADA
jgi:uncharacterized membrane protein